jgi:hypothetical protein
VVAEAVEPEADPQFGELHAAVAAGQPVAAATVLTGPADAAARRFAARAGRPLSQTEGGIHRTWGPEPALERMAHALAPATVGQA